MNYELAKKLKDAGFSQKGGNQYVDNRTIWDETMQSDYETSSTPSREEWVKNPTLSELIEACGDKFSELSRGDSGEGIKWRAEDVYERFTVEDTAEEAVANLWLELNKK